VRELRTIDVQGKVGPGQTVDAPAVVLAAAQVRRGG
jgi:hypothetical protein